MREIFAVVGWASIALGSSVCAQTVNLVESPPAKDCARIVMSTTVDGDQVVIQEGEKKSIKVSLAAEHRFVEKVLATHSGNGLVARVARNYEVARSTLSLGGNVTRQAVRPDRIRTVAQRGIDGAFLAFCPAGTMTREELELLGEHFDTLCIGAILPGKDVAVGDTWKVSNSAVHGLCALEALEKHDLTGKLVSANDTLAKIELSGPVNGIDLGAQVALTITATATYDLKLKKIVALEWKQDDMRDPGPVTPGFKASVVISLQRQPIDEPAEMADALLSGIPQSFEVPAQLTNIALRDPSGRFELAHPRDWKLTACGDKHTILRLMERGDHVAQVTITPIAKAEPGKHMEIKDFREATLGSPGWDAGQVLQEGEIKSEKPGRYLYRLSAAGKTEGIHVVQTFFLLANANGEQAVLAFTTRQQQLSKLGARDITIVDGLELRK